jgi:biotin-(acetyl-CoA carboxylase) ligase
MSEFQKILSVQSEVPLYLKHESILDSTNSEAKRSKGAIGNQGVWIVEADHQSSGYGRKNRKWISESSKNYYGTFCIRIKYKIAPGLWSLWVAQTLVSTLTSHISPGKNLFVKWPNDLCLLEAGVPTKVGGILSEQKGDLLICGVGLNCDFNPDISGDIQQGILPSNRLGVTKPIVQKYLHHSFGEIALSVFKNDFSSMACKAITKIEHKISSIPLKWFYYADKTEGPQSVEILGIQQESGSIHLRFQDGHDEILFHGSLCPQKLT